MERFKTIDIEHLHDKLSKINIMLPRQGYNMEEMTLYDILAYMTRFTHNVYLIKLKDGRYRTSYDIHHELFEDDTDVGALYKMVMSFIENDEAYYITPPKKSPFMWEEIWGKPNKPKIKYAEL